MIRGLVAALATFLVASTVYASNGVGRRTPPVYPRAQCITSIDRSVDPIFHLDIGLPQEDELLTPDEPLDSRRFQFFAVCEDEHAELLSLPNWVTQAEVDAALDRGAIEEAPLAEDVLDSSAWAGCVFAMNEAPDRIPISCEATEAGLDYDTRALPQGNYVIRGYTYEPALNLWSLRRGVLSVYDGTPIPSVGLLSPALDGRQVRQGDPFPIEGCTAGPPGTEVLLQWASLLQLGGDDDEAVWQTFATVDTGDGSFSVPFDPPDEAVNQIALIRAVIDPTGPGRWVDHAEGTFQVFADDEESDVPFGEPVEICGFYPVDPVDPVDEGSTGELTSGGEGSGGPTADVDGDSSCQCNASQGVRPVGLSLLLIVPLFRRRRRHHIRRA